MTVDYQGLIADMPGVFGREIVGRIALGDYIGVFLVSIMIHQLSISIIIAHDQVVVIATQLHKHLQLQLLFHLLDPFLLYCPAPKPFFPFSSCLPYISC